MIRIQIFCHTCMQIVDATVAARKARMVGAAFEDAHLHEKCFEEDPRGEEQEGTTDTSEDGSSSEGPEVGSVEASDTRVVH